MLDVRLLLLVPLHLVDLVVVLRLDVGVVVARVVGELALGGQVDHVGAHAVEEILRVGHEHEDARVVGELVLQPDARLHVEMVGGLVEEKHGRLRQERPAQSDTHAPTPRKILGLLGKELAAEAETHEDLRGADLEGRGVHAIDALINILEDLGIRAGGLDQVLGELLEPLDLVAHNVDNGIEGGALAGLSLLVEVEDVDVVRDGQLARREAGQERGLAAAVRAQEAVPVAVGKLEGGVLDQALAVQRQGKRQDLEIARQGVRRENTCAVASLGELGVIGGLGGGRVK
mmetsp:Transcript_53856/g.131662  ORF Transcript_53856/g.131662 Transcript_53856/m.131662 type:complete len:288 (+) Transcript_53856:923-1786(+)